MENCKEYLQATYFLDFDHPAFDSFLGNLQTAGSPEEVMVQLYYKVRDGFLYDPYHLDLRREALKASVVLAKKRAWCVEKATLLAACARKMGIPSRLGYAIVTNHIGVEKLLDYLKKKEIVFHGYTELWIGGKWTKCTPAFDRRVCRISGVEPLDWNGREDSMFQQYSNDRKFMEYLHFYGEYEDVPADLMRFEMQKHYPHLFEETFQSSSFSFLY